MGSPSVRIGCDRARVVASFVAVLAASAAITARAGHPLLSDDTGTQGTGHVELELGFSRATEDNLRVFEFGPQLSVGVLETVDAIVRPVWLENRSTGEGAPPARGIGDTAVDFKWRFFDAAPYSLGVRAGVLIPTGSEARGLSQGKAALHAALIGQTNVGEWTLIANLGWVQDPISGERGSLPYGTASAQWQPREDLKLSAELGTFRSPDPTRSWQTVSRFGAIVSLTKWLDVDAGYQLRLSGDAPVRVILAGATVRW